MMLDEMIGKTVTVTFVNIGAETGVLLEKSQEGVVLETDDAIGLYLWTEICCIRIGKPGKVTSSGKKKIEVTDSEDYAKKAKFLALEKMLPRNYTAQWDDEDTMDEIDIYDNDEEHVISVFLDDKIVVFYEKDFGLAEKIADLTEIYTVERDYRE